MKLSELIGQIQDFSEKHGDIETDIKNIRVIYDSDGIRAEFIGNINEKDVLKQTAAPQIPQFPYQLSQQMPRQPMQQQVRHPVVHPINQRVAQSNNQPNNQQVNHPIYPQQQVVQPVQQPVQQQVQQPVQQPVQQQVQQPVQQTAQQPQNPYSPQRYVSQMTQNRNDNSRYDNLRSSKPSYKSYGRY